MPVEPSWSCRRRAPRHGCQPCPRGSRPSSRECVPLWRHTLDEDSPANGNVSRAGDGCGEEGLGSSRRWHDHRPASRTGQGGSCLSSARNSRFLPIPRPGQLRVEGSLLRVEGGRPLPRLKGQRLDRLISAGGRTAPLSVARRRAAPPPRDARRRASPPPCSSFWSTVSSLLSSPSRRWRPTLSHPGTSHSPAVPRTLMTTDASPLLHGSTRSSTSTTNLDAASASLTGTRSERALRRISWRFAGSLSPS